MGQNYADRLRASRQAVLEIGEQMGFQRMWDCVQLALRNPEIMGKDVFGRARIEKLYQGVKEEVERYYPAFTASPEADYWQEKMDDQLREVWGDDLEPFESRYPYVKQYSYDKPRKEWK